MSTKLDQIMEKAKSNPKLRFTWLAHLLTPEFLTETWKQMNRRGASGVDGMQCRHFMRRYDVHFTSATCGARCGNSARRVLRGGTGTSGTNRETCPYPPSGQS
jgi:hypothetical protein